MSYGDRTPFKATTGNAANDMRGDFRRVVLPLARVHCKVFEYVLLQRAVRGGAVAASVYPAPNRIKQIYRKSAL